MVDLATYTRAYQGVPTPISISIQIMSQVLSSVLKASMGCKKDGFGICNKPPWPLKLTANETQLIYQTEAMTHVFQVTKI